MLSKHHSPSNRPRHPLPLRLPSPPQKTDGPAPAALRIQANSARNVEARNLNRKENGFAAVALKTLENSAQNVAANALKLLQNGPVPVALKIPAISAPSAAAKIPTSEWTSVKINSSEVSPAQARGIMQNLLPKPTPNGGESYGRYLCQL